MTVVRLRSALALARQSDPFCTLQTADAESLQTNHIGGTVCGGAQGTWSGLDSASDADADAERLDLAV
jgi:hypothetical protein